MYGLGLCEDWDYDWGYERTGVMRRLGLCEDLGYVRIGVMRGLGLRATVKSFMMKYEIYIICNVQHVKIYSYL
jgi:hypothetical protein